MTDDVFRSLFELAVDPMFASGHFTHRLARAGAINEGVDVLQKPFSLADLAGKLRQALESGA